MGQRKSKQLEAGGIGYAPTSPVRILYSLPQLLGTHTYMGVKHYRTIDDKVLFNAASGENVVYALLLQCVGKDAKLQHQSFQASDIQLRSVGWLHVAEVKFATDFRAPGWVMFTNAKQVNMPLYIVLVSLPMSGRNKRKRDVMVHLFKRKQGLYTDKYIEQALDTTKFEHMFNKASTSQHT